MKSKKSDKTEEKPKKKSSTAVKQTKSAPAKTVSKIKKTAVRKKAAVKPAETKVAEVKVPSKIKKTPKADPEKVKPEVVSIPKPPIKAEEPVKKPLKKVEKVEVAAKSAPEKKVEAKEIKVAAIKVPTKVKRVKKTEPETVKPEAVWVPKAPIKAEEPVQPPLKSIEKVAKVEAVAKPAAEKKVEAKEVKVAAVKVAAKVKRTKKVEPERLKPEPISIPALPIKAQAPVAQISKKAEKVEPALKPAAEKRVESKQAKIQPVETPPVRPKRSVPLKIPPILLEGDVPELLVASGPGERFSLGPRPPKEQLETEGELPEAYGTQHLMLTARDPHWLYAHWDLTRDQQRKYNAFSRDGHLALRIYCESTSGKAETEIQLQPESSHWFVPVEKAGTRYVAELGYYSAAEKWTVVATSGATLTPPDKMSEETVAEFTTIPLEVPLEKLFALVKEAVQEHPPLMQEVQQQREEHPDLPRITAPTREETHAPASAEAPKPAASAPVTKRRKLVTETFTPPQWTPQQEQALAEIISMDHVRRVWIGSLEITELLRRQYMKELAAKTEAQLGAGPGGIPTSPAEALPPRGESIQAIFSPTTKPQNAGKGFWFNVNAELIIYGATEPDATVTIAGRRIKLRRDGSFSYRFALPDGEYELPVVAISADETDGRAAELRFSRGTEYRGDVGVHPQDETLKKPVAESF